MKVLNMEDIASVRILTIELSEDEVDVYEACLRHILLTQDSAHIENLTGATFDEFENILNDLTRLIKILPNVRKRNS